MQFFMDAYKFFMGHEAMIFGVLFGLSEALSFIPQVKSNGVFQAIFNFLKGKQPSA